MDDSARRWPGSWHPDLVLTDLAMPVVDGFALIRAIRSDRDLRGTPIVVLSVRDRDDDKIRALDLGADDYVTKPFSLPELLARVRAQLRRTVGRPVSGLLASPISPSTSSDGGSCRGGGRFT